MTNNITKTTPPPHNITQNITNKKLFNINLTTNKMETTKTKLN